MKHRILFGPAAILPVLNGVSAVAGVVSTVSGIRAQRQQASDAKKMARMSDPKRIAAQEAKAAEEARTKARSLLASKQGSDMAFATLGNPGGPQGANRSLLGGA